MKSITRTVYGSYLNNAIITGLPFKVIPNTTLNEKLGINRDISLALPHNTYPQLRYFCIGNGGHQVQLSNNIPKIVPVQHHSTDAAPFRMIPFILREMDNDIPPGTRQQYALRRIEDINGTSFISYYLRRLDTSKAKVEMNLITVDKDGTKTTKPFIPNASNLNPVPQVISNTGTNVLEAKYVEVANEIEMIFTPEDAAELRKAANIMYNDEELSIISEIGLVSGVDKMVNVNMPGQGNIAVNEVIAAQMTNIFNTFRSCVVDNLGFKIIIKIGSNLPLWLTRPSNP